MTTISRSALVPYTPAEMFTLVDNIEDYPQFLPWCNTAIVLSRNEDEVRASLELSRGGIQKCFSTCNRLQRNKMIEMRLVEGPFSRLEGFWRFDPMGENACRVSLDLDFEFSNRLVSLALGPIFNQIANSLVDAFCERAMDVFGRR